MRRISTISQWLIATNTNQFCQIGDINTYFTESVQHQEAPEYIKGHRSPFDPLIRDKTLQPLGQGGALSGGFLRFSRIGQGPSFEDFWRFLGLFSNRPLAGGPLPGCPQSPQSSFCIKPKVREIPQLQLSSSLSMSSSSSSLPSLSSCLFDCPTCILSPKLLVKPFIF